MISTIATIRLEKMPMPWMDTAIQLSLHLLISFLHYIRRKSLNVCEIVMLSFISVYYMIHTFFKSCTFLM